MKPVSILTVAVLLGCSGSEVQNQVAAAAQQPAQVAVCSLLTSEEVLAATGWTRLTTIDSTSVKDACNFRGPVEMNDVVGILLAPGLPAMSSSADLVQFRSKNIGPNDPIKPEITQLDGFGLPAVRNQIAGMPLVTIEVARQGTLVSLTAPTFEAARGLMPKLLGRIP
jgi:hypothetical protein